MQEQSGSASTTARAFDVLYAAAPADFVGIRKQLAAECKARGDAEAAKRVAAARKPTQVAYLLNQLARQQPDEVAALVDIGRALERAQRAAIRTGDSATLREAIATQRKAISTLTTQAMALARKLEVHVAGHAITGALQAALGDPAIGAELEAGTLQTPPEAVGTFGGGFAEGDREEPEEKKIPAPRKSEARPKAATKEKGREAAVAKAAEKAKREEEARAEREARAAEAAAERERRKAEREARREAEAEARAAEGEAESLEAEAKKAVALAEKARAHATRLRTALG